MATATASSADSSTEISSTASSAATTSTGSSAATISAESSAAEIALTDNATKKTNKKDINIFLLFIVLLPLNEFKNYILNIKMKNSFESQMNKEILKLKNLFISVQYYILYDM